MVSYAGGGTKFRTNIRNVAGTWRASQTFADDVLLGMGNDNDIAVVNRSAVLNANTALSSVLIGTPVVPALAANSLIVSNTTASGDYVLALNNGGNSQAWQVIDASGPTQTLYYAGTARILLNSAGLTLDSTITIASGVVAGATSITSTVVNNAGGAVPSLALAIALS
jgi:hypothetical protein